MVDVLDDAFVCRACGAHEGGASLDVPDHEYGTGVVVTYVSCGACGSLTQHPMPSAATLASYYPATYHSFSGRGLLTRVRDARRIARLARMVEAAKGVVLDFGCGDGRFLVEAARALPHRFFGYEIGDATRVDEPVAGRVTIVRGHVDALFDVLPACDLVTMHHVIEHLPDPVDTLTRLASKLTAGGRLAGQTPRADSLERRAFGARFSGFHAPRHTVVFSERGLARALARAGLVDVDVRGAFNPAALAVSVASLGNGEQGGTIRRAGTRWLVALGAAAALAPLDLLSGAPGIQDFSARAPSASAGTAR